MESNEFSKKNWFVRHVADNPIITLFSYTVFVIATVWSVYTFLYDQRRLEINKNEIRLIEIKYEESEIRNNQMIAKVELLQKENTDLKMENNKMVEYLSSIPNSSENIKKTFTKNIESVQEVKTIDSNLVEKNNNEKYYFESTSTKINNSVIDKLSGITISISQIDVSNKIFGKISSENNSDIEIYNDIVGTSEEINNKGKKSKVIITNADYVSGTYKVLIKEL